MRDHLVTTVAKKPQTHPVRKPHYHGSRDVQSLLIPIHHKFRVTGVIATVCERIAGTAPRDSLVDVSI